MFVREAREEDYPELRRIYLESRKKHFHWANRNEMALDEFDRDTVEERILLAEDAGRILGFVSLYLPEDFIHLLFMHPDATGKGAGALLLDHAIAKMNKPVKLKCVSDNQRALNFYMNRGWKKVVEEGNPGEKYWVLAFE